METTYKILGGDGKEYGPATLEQMRGWIREGRVSAATQVWRNDQSAWVNARDFPELQLPVSPPVAAGPIGGALSIDRQQIVARMRSGGSWFYWIAGLSLINTIAALTGSGWGFIVGLGITRIVDGLAGGQALALAANVVIAGSLYCLGCSPTKGSSGPSLWGCWYTRSTA